jgi:hypothetical protein
MGLLQGILFGALLGVVAYAAIALVGRYIERDLKRRPDVVYAETVFPRRSLLESKLEHRRAQRRAKAAQLQAELTELRRRHFLIEKDVKEAHKESGAPIRVLGPEGRATFKYKAWLVNRQVQQAAQERKRHPALDMEWAAPQIIEIWAESLNDARREVQRAYPMPLGFSLLNITADLPSPDLVAATEEVASTKAVAG